MIVWSSIRLTHSVPQQQLYGAMLDNTTSPNYVNQPITAEAVTTIFNDAVWTNDSLTAIYLWPHLVALSDQTKIWELRSQAQSALEERNSLVYWLLTSQYTLMDLKICLIDLLYRVIAEFNHQQTIINLYWNYLLQEAKTLTCPTETLPLTSTSWTELPRSITTLSSTSMN